MSNGPHADEATTIDESPEPTAPGSSHDDPTNATTGEPSSGHPLDSSSATPPWAERFEVKRKLALDGFFNSVDSVVLIELVTIYYLDISTTVLLFRLITNVTPLANTLSILPPRLRPSSSKPSIFVILLVNLICIAYHLLFTLPQAGEGTRFDLNGHVLVNFIGQRALTGRYGRLRLVGMDLVVTALQIIGCGVLVQGEKKMLPIPKDDMSTAGRSTAFDVEGVAARASIDTAEGIEMQPLMRQSNEQARIASRRDQPLDSATQEASISTNEESARDGLEAIYTGQSILVSICIWSLLRDQYYERRNRVLAGRV